MRKDGRREGEKEGGREINVGEAKLHNYCLCSGGSATQTGCASAGDIHKMNTLSTVFDFGPYRTELNTMVKM